MPNMHKGSPGYQKRWPDGPQPKPPCSIDGCEAPSKGRGWCSKHYMRWQTHGDPLFTTRPSYGAGIVKDNGYIYLFLPDHPLAHADGYVAEHRYVLHEAGVDVTDLHVHHLNHDRTDNRPENLTTMTNAEHGRHHGRTNG